MSLIDDIRALSDEQLDEALAIAEALFLENKYDWTRHARPEQLAPAGDWLGWLILAGRGWGKSRTGAEWLKTKATANPRTRWFITAPTFADVRDTCVEGESGLLSVLPPSSLRNGSVSDTYNRSLGELTLENGSKIKMFSGDEPERFRGPQHHGGWYDELAAFRYADEAWDQSQFGLRLGSNPQWVATTTPKPTKLIKQLLSETGIEVTRGSTFDNAANLSASALAKLKAKYDGTRMGRQELYAELLTDVPGAMATFDQLANGRVTRSQDLVRIIVSVDPAVTNTAESDETGITVQGKGFDGEGYLLEDRSCRVDVDEWANRAIAAAMDWNAGMVLYETNQGADAIGVLLQNAIGRLGAKGIVIQPVRASKSKFDRALSLQQYIQQGRWHLVGQFPELEDQLTTWTLNDRYSPDRIDSVVHGFNELFNVEPEKKGFVLV